MHAEHAELIAALRRENIRLTVENAELGHLRTIIDAQDQLIRRAEKVIADQQETIGRCQKLLEDALKCP